MSLRETVEDLPLAVEGYGLETLAVAVSTDFTRKTTVVRLHGEGEEGVGEDVTYDGAAHDAAAAAGSAHPLTGRWTLGSFSAHLDTIPLFDGEPGQHAYRDYRRWAYESAALDLALRQAGRSLAEQLGREPRPVTFVVSTRRGLAEWRELYPGLRFKLDAEEDWTDDVVARLAADGFVATVDLKGHYRGTIVDLEPDAALYRRVAEGFPEAYVEDPWLTPDTDEALRPFRDRITWDAPIHSVTDVEGLPFPPRVLNSKPSRFGTVQRLLDFYDHCEAHGIGLYGGGQFELGPGRGQIQLLASLFHPDTPNDVAPAGFNTGGPRPGLPSSPLRLEPEPTGFRLRG
jgi:L-alanine-DL-glutamate epimerase-like enolase superfamily enzyme